MSLTTKMYVTLPAEILLEIAAFLVLTDTDQLNLLHLSQSCRWLRKIYNPLIQAHMADLLKTSTMVVIVLPVLMFESMNPELRPAHCEDEIHPGRNYQLLQLDIAHDDTTSTILPIRYFISQARSIQAIVIELYGGVDSAVVPLSTLLTICALRTGNLTVRHRDFSWSYYARRYPVSGEDVRSRKPRYVVALPPRHHILRLKSFKLDAHDLFSRSMYPWVHYVLNAVHLTHLSVSVKLEPTQWEYILPTLTLHKLQHLTLLGIPVQFPHLLSFLGRHSSLQILEVTNVINPIEKISFPRAYHHSNFLPSLERLIATPQYIVPFSTHNQLGFLPRLNTFDLLDCVYESRYGTFIGALGRKGDIKLFRPIFEHFIRLNGALGRKDGIKLFRPISEYFVRSSGGKDAEPETGTSTDVPQRMLHLKLYAMSLAALVESFTFPDNDDLPNRIRPMNDIRTITLMYTEDCIPPPLAMHIPKHWAPRQEKLTRAFERAKELFVVDPGDTNDLSLNTLIQTSNDTWLLNLFLCHAFPRLQRIVSEYRDRKHEVEVDRSLFDC